MKKDTGIIRFLEVIIFIVVIVTLGYVLFFRLVTLNGKSMEPNFFAGDTLIFTRLDSPLQQYNFGFPDDFQRGDLVLIEKQGRIYMKRIVALPGEEVSIRNNYVFIDKQRLDEDYLPTTTRTRLPGVAESTFRNENKLLVDDNYYFVMGDNREQSEDSRHRDFGQVLKAEIKGKALLMVWPPKHAGFL